MCRHNFPKFCMVQTFHQRLSFHQWLVHERATKQQFMMCRQVIFLSKSFNTFNKSSQWLRYQLHIISFSRMKIISCKLWTNYIQKAIKEQSLHTQREFIWTTHYEINDSRYTAQQSSYCMCIIIVFAQCSSLQHSVMGIDLNILDKFLTIS